MDNKMFKDYLAHAWVNTSPEVISNYNREYYKQHANDWVTRKNKRMNKEESVIDSGTNEHNYWNPVLRNEDKPYIVPDYEWAGEKGAELVIAGKEKIGEILEERKQERIERGTQTASIGYLIKQGFDRLKKLFGF